MPEIRTEPGTQPETQPESQPEPAPGADSPLEISGKAMLPEVIGHTVRNFTLHAIPAALLFSVSLAFYEILGWQVAGVLVASVFAAAAIFFDAPLLVRGAMHLAFLARLPRQKVQTETGVKPMLSVMTRTGLATMSLLILVPLLNVALDVALIVRLIVVESR